jgi:hypothetical protein
VDAVYAEVQSVEDYALTIRRLALQIDRAATKAMTGEHLERIEP